MEKKSRKVSVDFSLTLNLGNFNSAKLGATLEETTMEDFESTFDDLYGRIKEKVFAELKVLNKQFKPPKDST